MPTEEQLDVSRLWSSISNNNAWGQRLTVSNRIISKLSFYLWRQNSPNGEVTYYIRDLLDNILASKLWGNSINVPTTPTWLEVTLDSPLLVNEEVYILVACTNTLSAPNLIQVYDSNGVDVKPGEYMVKRTAGTGNYTNYTGQDFGYIYTYSEKGFPAGLAPGVIELM